MSFLTVCLNPTLQKTLYFPFITHGIVNRTADHRLEVSGKGINVTRVLTQLGKKALHLTQLGGEMKPLFLSLCEQDGLSVEWAESNSQIRFCYTLLTGNDSGVTELVEESEPVSAGTEERLLEKFNALLQGAGLQGAVSYLIISGTKAAGFSDTVIPKMVCKAKEKGLFVILDIKGNDLIESLKFEPDIIKPNLEEFAMSFNLDSNSPQINSNLQELVLDLSHKHKCRIILTNGIKPIIVADKNNFYEFNIHPALPPQKIVPINTTGCGDAFTAGLAAALEDGADFNTAISEGIRCGALNAGFVKPGVIAG